jgi:hypothetical protein
MMVHLFNIAANEKNNILRFNFARATIDFDSLSSLFIERVSE